MANLLDNYSPRYFGSRHITLQFSTIMAIQYSVSHLESSLTKVKVFFCEHLLMINFIKPFMVQIQCPFQALVCYVPLASDNSLPSKQSPTLPIRLEWTPLFSEHFIFQTEISNLDTLVTAKISCTVLSKE